MAYVEWEEKHICMHRRMVLYYNTLKYVCSYTTQLMFWPNALPVEESINLENINNADFVFD